MLFYVNRISHISFVLCVIFMLLLIYCSVLNCTEADVCQLFLSNLALLFPDLNFLKLLTDLALCSNYMRWEIVFLIWPESWAVRNLRNKIIISGVHRQVHDYFFFVICQLSIQLDKYMRRYNWTVTQKDEFTLHIPCKTKPAKTITKWSTGTQLAVSGQTGNTHGKNFTGTTAPRAPHGSNNTTHARARTLVLTRPSLPATLSYVL